MGYSCTTAALRTLQAIKTLRGADMKGSNEIGLQYWVPGFYERGEEQPDGSIVGTVTTAWSGIKSPGAFHISPEGKVLRFDGLPSAVWRAAEQLGKAPDFHPRTVAL